MGWVTMSERELRRVEVLGQVSGGRLDADTAAGLLGISRRHLFRLLKTFRTEGAAAVRHRARGRAPNCSSCRHLPRSEAISIFRRKAWE